MSKPISEIRASNAQEFEKDFPDCFTEMILGQGPGIRTGYARPFPSKDEKKTAKLKSFLSSAEERILTALVEKIEGMKIELKHNDWCEHQRPGCHCGYEEKNAYNDAPLRPQSLCGGGDEIAKRTYAHGI